jgi:hypothetical protein
MHFLAGFAVGIVVGVILLTALYVAAESTPEEWRE